MRFLILAAAFIVPACSKQQSPAPDIPPGSYAGNGRDRLCIEALDGEALRVGIITYGAGDQNCQVAGKVAQSDGRLTLTPTGEGDCRIPLVKEGTTLRIGAVPQACDYYCAPDASLGGERFDFGKYVGAATDLAGDPLC
ncbi:MAG: hypothetical protein LH465_09920 [Sphingomonas bacterium]|nr:hypothetical protein [Sphingomonas bacterium]